MPDAADDASSPDPPKPGDVAPPPANRSDSSESGKLRVFISYSRDDLHFADQLNAALEAYGFECFIDRGISGGEAWKRRVSNLIGEADTVIFVLSPPSARSETCAGEVEEAARLGKRILPVICRSLEGASPPPRLGDLNYIFFYADPKVSESGFGTGLAKLIAALNTDFEWLREHTRYLQRATEWDRGGRPANRLLSGDDIAEAKAWAARRPKSAPEPTALHLDFIRASEEEAEARSSAQRKQLDAMAAAQAERGRALHEAEAALQQAADAQRKRARVRNIAFVIVSGLAVLAGWLYWNAEQQRKAAEEQTALAEKQTALAEQQRAFAQAQKEQGDDILTGATNIIVKLQTKMDDDTKTEAFTLFLRGADHGDSNSMRNLGVSYRDGLGTAQDYVQAREWFEKAATRDETEAMVDLGRLYANGQGTAQDYAQAREWYAKAAARDSTDAMDSLGWLYANGHGVALDYVKARDWYAKAAGKDNADAMVNLGWLYANGHGVAQDYAQAREWYAKAAGKDNSDAMVRLGWLYAYGRGVAQDYAQAREWYAKAAGKDNTSAMVNLGWLYANGHGVAQDYAQAREWYAKAARKDNAEAMVNLGWLYANGHGVPQDYGEAREWYAKAAGKNNTDAMVRLGGLYANGRGMAQDYAQAREWYAKAADNDNTEAMVNLGWLYANGRGVAQDYVQAREWYAKAAGKDNSAAMVNLGGLYANGQGVAQDYAQAREWYAKAAGKDNSDAMVNLGWLYANGHGAAQDYVQARKWYEKAVAKGDERAKTALEQLSISEAFEAGRYPEALQLQEAMAQKMEARETEREGKPGPQTADALLNLAGYALLAGEFPKALTVAERAHALFPDDLAIEANRAHALMFRGSEKESKALYLAHKGEPVAGQDGKPWERVIAEDFAEFRKAGLTHPMMAEIEKELGVSP